MGYFITAVVALAFGAGCGVFFAQGIDAETLKAYCLLQVEYEKVVDELHKLKGIL